MKLAVPVPGTFLFKNLQMCYDQNILVYSLSFPSPHRFEKMWENKKVRNLKRFLIDFHWFSLISTRFDRFLLSLLIFLEFTNVFLFIQTRVPKNRGPFTFPFLTFLFFYIFHKN